MTGGEFFVPALQSATRKRWTFEMNDCLSHCLLSSFHSSFRVFPADLRQRPAAWVILATALVGKTAETMVWHVRRRGSPAFASFVACSVTPATDVLQRILLAVLADLRSERSQQLRGSTDFSKLSSSHQRCVSCRLCMKNCTGSFRFYRKEACFFAEQEQEVFDH